MAALGVNQPKYPPKAVAFARRLHEDGYTINEVREALAKRGYHPKRDTVLYWVDEGVREAKLLSQRRQRRRGTGPRRPAQRKGWRYRLDRMEQLRNVGLSYRDIAALMSHDFEDIELETEQVRSMLQGKVQAKTIRKHLWPQGNRATHLELQEHSEGALERFRELDAGGVG